MNPTTHTSPAAPLNRTGSATTAEDFAGPIKPEIPESDVLRHVAPTEAQPPEEILKDVLANRGLKYTQERREILQAVLSTHHHFDADWLYVSLQKAGSRVSKATVYRTLALLCECGLAREVFQGPHGAYYEHIYGHEHHEHMICVQCGKVIEFISHQLETLQEEACRAHGFHAVRHHLQIFGYCKECHPCGANFPPVK